MKLEKNNLNESETRAEYIDPRLKRAGWGEVEGSKVLREFRITDGKIQTGGNRSRPEIADYVLLKNPLPAGDFLPVMRFT